MPRRHPAQPGATTTQGYGFTHQKERARWAPVVASGQARCAQPVCLMPNRTIHSWQRWDLGHTDDRTAYLGPCHMRCNRTDGARKGGRSNAARYQPHRAVALPALSPRQPTIQKWRRFQPSRRAVGQSQLPIW